MLSRGLRMSFVVGIVLVLFALGLHAVLKYYNAPTDVEYGLINTFAATFASTILAFFIGALLYDYQAERNDAKRDEQLRRLLAAELNEVLEGLSSVNAMKVSLSDGPVAEAVITHLQPTVVEEAIRGGFFDPPRMEGALRLARNMRAYNAKVSYLLSTLSAGTATHPGSDRFVLHAIEEMEETRQAILADTRLLSKPG